MLAPSHHWFSIAEDKMSANTQNECTIADISDSALDNRFEPIDTAREFAEKSGILISELDELARVHPFIAGESYSSALFYS